LVSKTGFQLLERNCHTGLLCQPYPIFGISANLMTRVSGLICRPSQAIFLLLRKILIFRFSGKYGSFRPSRPGKRGVRVVTDGGRVAMDVGALSDGQRVSGRRSRVVLAPLGWC